MFKSEENPVRLSCSKLTIYHIFSLPTSGFCGFRTGQSKHPSHQNRQYIVLLNRFFCYARYSPTSQFTYRIAKSFISTMPLPQGSGAGFVICRAYFRNGHCAPLVSHIVFRKLSYVLPVRYTPHAEHRPASAVFIVAGKSKSIFSFFEAHNLGVHAYTRIGRMITRPG
jgi:hypothetical protein